jgi:hypothetical protein
MHWLALCALVLAVGGFSLGASTAWASILSLALKVVLAVLAVLTLVCALLLLVRRRG